MLEYEYSFKVKELKPYIEYCIKNGFEKVEQSSQVRILYTSKNKILARITTKECDGKIKTVLDFKDEDGSEKVLKALRETIPLELKESDMESVRSILDILGYKKYKELIRKRIVYKKDKAIFEIDDYLSPEIMHVVAIEGEKNQVDKIYNDINKKIN